MKGKLAIVGFAPTSRSAAPYNDPDFDIWACNELQQIEPNARVDLYFQLHPFDVLKQIQNYGRHDSIAWLKERDIPVMMLDVHPELPKSEKLPGC